MTVEPSVAWTPDPDRQRRADFSVEDVLRLPDDAPRVELRNGVLSVVPVPSGADDKVTALLCTWLGQHLPADVESLTGVGVAVGFKTSLEPDVVLLRRPVAVDRHFHEPAQVLLAVEVVSPGTKRRDRLEKPAEYAAAGIPHLWRVELDPVHVFAYDLVDGRYELAAESETELVTRAPAAIRLPIRDITP